MDHHDPYSEKEKAKMKLTVFKYLCGFFFLRKHFIHSLGQETEI